MRTLPVIRHKLHASIRLVWTMSAILYVNMRMALVIVRGETARGLRAIWARQIPNNPS